MKLFMRFFSVVVAVSILVFMFNIAGVSFIEGYHPLYPLIDTECSSRFTIEKFEKIKIGDKKSFVIEQLGEPLYIDGEPNSIFRQYEFTADGRASRFSKEGDMDDFAWFSTEINIDRHDTVTAIRSWWSHD